jgi:hypothetical protein
VLQQLPSGQSFPAPHVPESSRGSIRESELRKSLGAIGSVGTLSGIRRAWTVCSIYNWTAERELAACSRRKDPAISIIGSGGACNNEPNDCLAGERGNTATSCRVRRSITFVVRLKTLNFWNDGQAYHYCSRRRLLLRVSTCGNGLSRSFHCCKLRQP